MIGADADRPDVASPADGSDTAAPAVAEPNAVSTAGANRVLILRWAGSTYDALGGILDLIARELISVGFDVAVFTTVNPDWPHELIEILKQGGISFALTMSGIGTDLAVDGKLIWETAKVPLFNWNCDHPCYFAQRHSMRNPYVLHGYVFPDHARYNIHHLRPNGTAFSVHMGIPPRSFFPQAPLPPTSRNGRILFAKSGMDINQIEASWRGYGPILRQIAFAAAEELFSRSTADFLPTLQRIAEPAGLFLDGNSRLTMRLMRDLDEYIRYKRADLVMNTLLRYPVDVFGSGWDHIRNGPNAAKVGAAKIGAAKIGAGTTDGAKFHDAVPGPG
jgi:hypothetical protein